MRRISLCLLLMCICSLAAAPIAAEQAIPARIVGTLEVRKGEPPMHMPTAVAIDTKHNAFVADGANDRIVQFAPDGKYVGSIAPGLKQPTGVFVDQNDSLWIADSGNHRVLHMLGSTAETIDLPADHDRPAKPTDLLLTSDGGRLYVVDNDNHRLLVRDQHTGTWKPIGHAGTAPGQFQYPFMLALGMNNDLFITEAIGGRAQILTAAHRWAGQIGEWGIELGQLYRPKGIAVDAQGRVFISDSTTRVVQVFSPQGNPLGVLTDEKHQPIRFEHPMGLRFDTQGRLYVVELKADRVAIVELLKPTGSGS